MDIKYVKTRIRMKKNKLRYYVIVGSLLPIVLLSFALSYIYLDNLEKVHSAELNNIREVILEEKKIFLRDAIKRTIYEIEHTRMLVAEENKLKDLTKKEIDAISIAKIVEYLRNIRLTKEKYYIWINQIVDYNGGDNYAKRVVHPNLPETEGMFLSTFTEDIKGSKPYKDELEGIKQDGEVFYSYYFKKLDSEIISHKLSFAKIYEPFDWVVATGLYLDDFDKLIALKKLQLQNDYDNKRNILLITSFTFILLAFVIAMYFQSLIRKLVLSYESQINNYTKELVNIATTDNLTGLCNRAKIDSSCTKELTEAKRYNQEFSIIMIDIDHFKNVNDTYGHQIGDSVLQQVSKILQDSVREVDMVGRWGGEEFLIICPQTNLDGARRLSEHMRQTIETYQFDVIGEKTCSFGVSSYHENDTQESMIQRADKALYQAKNKGRNIVCTEANEKL